MNKRGSSLAECMVYLVILGTITVLSYGLIARMSKSIITDTSHFVSLYLAHDMLMRDLKRAAISKGKWKTKPGFLLFQTKTEAVLWKVKDNTLVRIVGTYNWAKDIWGKKTTSVVAKSISNFSCTFIDIKTNIYATGTIGQESRKVSIYCRIAGKV